jgi:hypothetical protein
MDIANIFASQGATESRVDTLEDTIKQNAAQAQAQVQQALDTTNSTKSTIEESIGGPLLGTGVNKIMRSKALRAVFKKAGTSPEELAVADKASVDTPEDIEQMGKDMANAKDVSDLFYNPAFDQTALGNDAERAVQSGMKTVDSYATDTARLLGADEDVATFASKANDFYQAAKSVVSSAPGAISDFASSARQGVSDLASATKGAVVDAATSAAEAAAAVLPESVTAAATTVATATTEAIGGAIASSQGFIDPITDFIGLAVGLAGVIGGAESDPDKAAEVIPKIPEVYSSYVPGV